MQVNEIAPNAWEERVGESISLYKIHAGGMWLFSREMITSCDQGLCKWGLTVYLPNKKNTEITFWNIFLTP